MLNTIRNTIETVRNSITLTALFVILVAFPVPVWIMACVAEVLPK